MAILKTFMSSQEANKEGMTNLVSDGLIFSQKMNQHSEGMRNHQVQRIGYNIALFKVELQAF
jgi:hypothetical protein